MVEPLTSARLSDIRAFERDWAALRECASPWCDTERLLKLFPAVDWHRLLLLAEEHGVPGQLAACLNDSNAPAVPAEIKQTLVENRRAQNFLTLRLTAELFRLLQLFSAQGISALAIKGPVLAAQAYGDSSVRSYGDLDLLVRQATKRQSLPAPLTLARFPGSTSSPSPMRSCSWNSTTT